MTIPKEIMEAMQNAGTVEEMEGIMDMYGITLEDICDLAAGLDTGSAA